MQAEVTSIRSVTGLNKRSGEHRTEPSPESCSRSSRLKKKKKKDGTPTAPPAARLPLQNHQASERSGAASSCLRMFHKHELKLTACIFKAPRVCEGSSSFGGLPLNVSCSGAFFHFPISLQTQTQRRLMWELRQRQTVCVVLSRAF